MQIKKKKGHIYTIATDAVAWTWPGAKLPPNCLLTSLPRGTRERSEKAKTRKKFWIKIRSLLGEGKAPTYSKQKTLQNKK